jgi:hypothetical protein
LTEVSSLHKKIVTRPMADLMCFYDCERNKVFYYDEDECVEICKGTG